MQDDHANVYVKYLPLFLEDSSLYKIFSPFGNIISAKVMIDHTTGKSRGYGYARIEEASKSIKSLDGHKIGGKTLLCKLSHSFPLREPCCNLYIKPLPVSLNEEELREIFEKYGIISSVKLVSDFGYTNTQIGFVMYEKVQDAIRAIQELDGTKMFTQLPPLIVKYAESDTQRMKRQYSQPVPSSIITTTNRTYATNDYTITTTTTTTTMKLNDNNDNIYNYNNNDNFNNNYNLYYPSRVHDMPTMYVPMLVYNPPCLSPIFHPYQ